MKKEKISEITIKLAELKYKYYIKYLYKGIICPNKQIIFNNLYWHGETSHHYHTNKRFNVFVSKNKEYLRKLIVQNKNELIILLYEDYLTKLFYMDSLK